MHKIKVRANAVADQSKEMLVAASAMIDDAEIARAEEVLRNAGLRYAYTLFTSALVVGLVEHGNRLFDEEQERTNETK